MYKDGYIATHATKQQISKAKYILTPGKHKKQPKCVYELQREFHILFEILRVIYLIAVCSLMIMVRN